MGGSGVGSYSIASAHAESTAALYRMMGRPRLVPDRPEAAERHLRVAAGLAERMRARVWLARTRVEEARARLARGDRRDRVAPLLAEAGETAAHFGAAGVERDAAGLLEVRRSVGA